MATLLSTLKLVTATRENKTSPVIQRRQKLINKIDEQISLAIAQPTFRTLLLKFDIF